jgi:hypothetical protein
MTEYRSKNECRRTKPELRGETGNHEQGTGNTGRYAMKKRDLLMFACGVLVGASLVLCVGATGKKSEEPPPKFADLRVMTYPGGMARFFDVRTGRLFVYDSNMEKCSAKRQLVMPGKSMRKL